MQLRVARDAWSRECPMLSVALRTRVEAQLLPTVGPAPQPLQLNTCSPVLGLKHSVEWALAPPAAGANAFRFVYLDSRATNPLPSSAFQLLPRLLPRPGRARSDAHPPQAFQRVDVTAEGGETYFLIN